MKSLKRLIPIAGYFYLPTNLNANKQVLWAIYHGIFLLLVFLSILFVFSVILLDYLG